VTWRIEHGDAREVMRAMEPESVRCCVTSPPYWGLRDYKCAGQLGLEPTPEGYVAALVEVLREVRRVLRKDGTLWLVLGDSYASSWPCNRRNTMGAGSLENGKREARPPRLGSLKDKDLVGIPWRVALALQADGWWLRQRIVWAKPNPMPESVRDRCTVSCDEIFMLTRSAKYFYDADAIREPDAGLDHARSVLNGQPSLEPSGGIMPEHKGLRTTEGRNGDGRNARNVWTIATHPYPEAHFATFPPELPRRCILAGSRPGDVVLDPFAGAGTTLLVADRLGRDGIGIDLNAEYCEMARRRIVDDAPLLNESEKP
jgi:DNA modification methylase